MKSSEIRESFLDFFKKKGHTIVSSDSVVTSSDPTLLFTSAGMVQFKKHFLGEIKSDFTRAASSQKCFRTSDIDQVGLTARHLTFFEMLGNFSFGDYFKEQAILWGWEYLTKVLDLSEKRLYTTVYNDDIESFNLWKKFLPENKIFKLGKESNFWNMGPTGPCGPCSEILWDMGENAGCKKASCHPGCDCDRYLEIWNLVFTQFNRKENGALDPLPRKNIDTGMGLERLVYVVQGKTSPFETDLFMPVIDELSRVLSVSKNDQRYQNYFRMIADHIRAAAFLISDGILPSNEGRGYVLRRIMRRAVRSGRQMGSAQPFLFTIMPVVASIMKHAYPELNQRRENITSIIKLEEERFLETLETGMRHLEELTAKSPKVLPGDEVFKLHDTYGFPLELTREIAGEKGKVIDEDGFKRALLKAQEVSRKSWKGSGEIDMSFYGTMHKKYGDTEFIGYESCDSSSTVKAILKGRVEVEEIKAGDEADIVLNQTPFYGESGGQAGDTGVFLNKKKHLKITVINTVKPYEGFIVHNIKVEEGNVRVGDKISAVISIDERKSIMRHHTATHLLHKALKKVLGTHIMQAGSLVASERFRFDYTHPGSTKKDETNRVEELVNNVILENYPVKTAEIDLNTAKKMGVIALFGEKYGSRVRCVFVGDTIENAYSAELCGGTHTETTGNLGIFKILSDVSIASGVRRIEAVAGKPAYNYIKKSEKITDSYAEKLKVSPADIGIRIDKLVQSQKAMEKEITDLKNKLMMQPYKDLSNSIIELNGLKVMTEEMNDLDSKSIRTQSDIFKDKFNLDIVVLTSSNNGRSSFVITANEKAQKGGLDAKIIAKTFSNLIKGSGGGRNDFAQGGGKDPSLIPDALNKIKDFIKGF